MTKKTPGEPDLVELVESLIRDSDKKLNATEITTRIYGVDTTGGKRRVYRALESLIKSNKIRKTKIGKSVTIPYIYSIVGEQIETDICSICNSPKLLSDLIDGMCQFCKDQMEQTVPSATTIKIVKPSDKINRAFRNASDIPPKKIEPETPPEINALYPYKDGHTRNVDILLKYLNSRVKVSLKNSSTVLKGTLIHLEGNYAGIQTGNGPLDVSIDAIAAIGQWEDPERRDTSRRFMW